MKALLVLPLLLTACLDNVVALSPKAEGVQVVRETEKPLRCEVRGKISGTSRSTTLAEAKTGAENDLRNHAAEYDANFALVEAERHGPVGTSSQVDYFVGGKALVCQTEEMEAAADKAEAEARDKREQEAAAQEAKEAEEKEAAAQAKKAGKKK
jgi:hypothetical protein